MSDDTDIPAMLQVMAPIHQVPWALGLAICAVESGLDTWAMRYEPSYKYLVGDDNTLTGTERMQQMTSWGLMQVMGAVARGYGYTGWLSRLCIPQVGAQYGLLHLGKFYAHYQSWPDAIASYNAGKPRLAPDGTYLNQSYVDQVTRHWAQLDPTMAPGPSPV